MKTITFLRRKLSKLHKKGTILDVTIEFFLKQSQTRASIGLIILALSLHVFEFVICHAVGLRHGNVSGRRRQ